jgi:hypothetical protein
MASQKWSSLAQGRQGLTDEGNWSAGWGMTQDFLNAKQERYPLDCSILN